MLGCCAPIKWLRDLHREAAQVRNGLIWGLLVELFRPGDGVDEPQIRVERRTRLNQQFSDHYDGCHKAGVKRWREWFFMLCVLFLAWNMFGNLTTSHGIAPWPYRFSPLNVIS